MARPAHEAGRRRSTTESATPRQPSSRARGSVTDRRGVDPPSPQPGDRLWKVGRDPLTGVGPAMEGTSGAAEHALLRGRAGEAALSCESPRQRAPGRAGARASGQRGGFVAGGQTNSRRRRRLRAADRHEPTTGGVRADRVGAKRSPRAVAVGGVIQRRNTSSLRRPLTRETSTGRCTKVTIGHPQPGTRPKGERGVEAERFSDPRGARGESLALWVRVESHELDGFGVQTPSSTTGRTAVPAGDRRCGAAEFGLRGRARGSQRLQKSTGGARPLSPMREERVDNEGRSSLGARERSWGERAPEAGSSAAKRRVRWRALHLSEMAGAKALTREHLSMEGVSGRTKSFVLTSGRWKRSWSSS
jgi:hypothetical protein